MRWINCSWHTKDGRKSFYLNDVHPYKQWDSILRLDLRVTLQVMFHTSRFSEDDAWWFILKFFTTLVTASFNSGEVKNGSSWIFIFINFRKRAAQAVWLKDYSILLFVLLFVGQTTGLAAKPPPRYKSVCDPRAYYHFFSIARTRISEIHACRQFSILVCVKCRAYPNL